MGFHPQTYVAVRFLALTLLIAFAKSASGDSRLAVFLGRDDRQTTFRFLGRKQEFAAVQEHLKKVATIDKSLEVTFVVQHDDVPVSELVELIYKVYTIGFTNIVIETSVPAHDESLEDIVIRKLQVIPVIERSTPRP